MRNINIVAKKMARKGLKIANSLGCAFHFESDFMIVHRIIHGEPNPKIKCTKCEKFFVENSAMKKQIVTC